MRVRRFGILLCLGLAACQMSLPFKKNTPDATSAGVTAPAGTIMGGPIRAPEIWMCAAVGFVASWLG